MSTGPRLGQDAGGSGRGPASARAEDRGGDPVGLGDPKKIGQGDLDMAEEVPLCDQVNCLPMLHCFPSSGHVKSLLLNQVACSP